MGKCREFEGIVMGLALDMNGLELTVNVSGTEERAVLVVSNVHSEMDMIPYTFVLKGQGVKLQMSGDSVYVSEIELLSGRFSGTKFTSRKYGEV